MNARNAHSCICDTFMESQIHSTLIFSNRHLLPTLNVNESMSAVVTAAEAKSIISARHCVMETQGSGEINRLAATEYISDIMKGNVSPVHPLSRVMNGEHRHSVNVIVA